MTPWLVIPAQAGIQEMREKTGFRLFASLGRNDGGVEIKNRAKFAGVRALR